MIGLLFSVASFVCHGIAFLPRLQRQRLSLLDRSLPLIVPLLFHDEVFDQVEHLKERVEIVLRRCLQIQSPLTLPCVDCE